MRSHVDASVTTASAQTLAMDESRESRGAVGEHLLRWQERQRRELITRACFRVEGGVSVEAHDTREWTKRSAAVGPLLNARSDLVRVSAGGVVPEVSLSALQVVLGALPLHAPWPVARRRSQRGTLVGDGVVEAVGLDARGGLLPGAAGARLLRESAQRFREVWGWPFEREAEVFAPADRELRFERGGALAQDAAFGLPLGAVGQPVREVALTLDGRRYFPLGEL